MDKALNTLYHRIGGMEACQRLSELFHERVATDPVLKEIFPNNLAPAIERLALFLAEQLGGPSEYTAKRGKQSLLCRHAHLPLGAEEAEAWLKAMSLALLEAEIAEPERLLLNTYFTETAKTVSDPLLPFYRLPLGELQALLEKKPVLATVNEHGRTLLGEACGRWDSARVKILLEYGADVIVKDRLNHDPLSRATGGKPLQPENEGCAVVELLLQQGADVNGRSGVGQMTPLHGTARRGTVALAKVLLAWGAEREAKDTKGETPLRRAVNCGQEGMVRLLLAYRADPLTRDKQGRTPLDAARHERIREALQDAAVHFGEAL
jgi:hemoglobin